MIYEILNKSDFSAGASLSVKIPEHEVDRKALYTIVEDRPDFILPFRYKSIDGQVELVYQIGALSKLQYLSGCYLPKEYAELWFGLLSPFLDCGDWFMKPNSFVLNEQNIYCDDNKKTVKYVYIPSIRECSDHEAIREMAAEFTYRFSVADPKLENKVLRMIMKDFNINEFLQMLKPYLSETAPLAAAIPISVPMKAAEAVHNENCPEDIPIPPERVTEQTPEKAAGAPGDIIIEIPDSKKTVKREKEKKEKKQRKARKTGGFFSRLKSVAREEVVIG